MPPLSPSVAATIKPGWSVQHSKFGWGVLKKYNPSGSGRHVVTFSDGSTRLVDGASLLNAQPPADQPKPPPEPTKPELRRKKSAVTALLEAGEEAKADQTYRADSHLRRFWPQEIYDKCKKDCRLHWCNEIQHAARIGDVEKARRIRDAHCSEWMTDDEYREPLLSGLVEGERWSEAETLGLMQDVLDAATIPLIAQALAIDLESDGERIWEIGVAANGSKELLLSRGDTHAALDVAMNHLAIRIGEARILVGHNVLAWDWPIVSKRLDLQARPLIWDTLLVQYLIEPQAPSHSLGSNHRAHDDAAAALHLFETQLRRLPVSVVGRVLSGTITSFEELLNDLCDPIHDRASYAREVEPSALLSLDLNGRLLLLPEGRLRELDWVPGTTVVPADASAGLPAAWRQIDATALEEGLQQRGEISVAGRILLAIARSAERQGVALRRNMLPFWLIEGDTDLSNLLDAAAVVPSTTKGIRLSSIPASTDWWANAKKGSYIVEGLSDDVAILGKKPISPSTISGRTGSLPAAPLVRIGDLGTAPLWLHRDRAAHVLDPNGGLVSFRTLRIDADTSRRLEKRIEPQRKPLLATRRNHVLHPTAVDQASYWIEVLRTFREVASRSKGRVAILLVVSSSCPELIALISTGIAELGIGEVKPTHRSQREHLLRAYRSGASVVAPIDEWRTWQSLAQSIGIELQPVVEALPVEEWFASNEERSFTTSSGSTPSKDPFAEGQIVATDAAAILEKLPELVEERLHGWLRDIGIADPEIQAVLIDSRASALGKSLAHVAESFQLLETPIPDSELQRVSIALCRFKVEREEAPSGYAAMESFLVANWQPKSKEKSHPITGFKTSQRVAMEAICSRTSNVLVSLPTGEGKSVLFQVPALCRGLRNRRLTLVISPLKALMRDQVERLREQGFSESVDFLSGDRPSNEITDVLQGILDHRIVLLYVAPERLRSEAFVNALDKRMMADGGLEHLVIDEVHCVNQWGYEFRPDYFHAAQVLMAKCKAVDADSPTPCIFLSATITASDRYRLQAMLTGTSDGTGSPLPLLVRPDSFSNPLREHIAVTARKVRGHLNDKQEFASALEERLPYIEEAISDARRNSEITGQRSAVLVFASSRKHTEIVAQRLIAGIGGRIDYYHAGLDSTTREEIYKRFLDGDLDVLVATKAFGMGMDIPDIHWVVHLSPPSYLEDFLQEVGRIGRGAKERERAKLEKLSAVLLHSDRDFEGIRSLRARNAVSLPIIKDLYREIDANANELDGQRVAIVSHDELSSALKLATKSASAARAAATRIRMGLYWLERSGRVRLCGSIADVMVVTIHPNALKRLASESGVVGEVAELILEASSFTTLPNVANHPSGSTPILNSPVGRIGSSEGDGLIDRAIDVAGQILGRLASSIGVLFGRPRSTTSPASPIGVMQLPESPATERTTSVSSEAKTVALNLSQIRLRSKGVNSIGDALACLSDIETRGGISMRRDIEITRRKLAREPSPLIDALFDSVDNATRALIERLEVHGRLEFDPQELLNGFDGPIAVVEPQKLREYNRAFINGLRWLARSSGLRLRQIARDDDQVVWQAILARSECQKANARREKTRKVAEALFETVAGKASVPLKSLIEALRSRSADRRFHESDLRRSASLLASMNLLSISTELVPLSHVVVLPEVEGDLEDRTDVWKELSNVNDLAEARILAMEVFANIDAGARESFIQGYFSATTAEELRQFLETQLGEISIESESEGLTTFVSEMREKVRATKAVEFFERFKTSEEPSQWEVVKAPFDQNIMVNAGPGAGKTFVLVGRIAHLIREQNINPAQIIVLAFNRAVVFEIKRRIKELFQSLGYAAYVRRLRVSTFHSLAFRSLAQEGMQVSRKNSDDVLSMFAERLDEDPSFAERVANGARCILVDEFQDMSDDVYKIVRKLHAESGTRTGVTVIGDDDQDILRWNRPRRDFSERYFELFSKDFGGENFKKLALSVNFRSGSKVVDRSQSVITQFFNRTSHSRRLKETPLRARLDSPDGFCHQTTLKEGQGWEFALERTSNLLEGIAGDRSESTAILCRTNAEASEAHRVLGKRFPQLQLLGAANLDVAELRHVGLWLDHLREATRNRDEVLSEDLWKRLQAEAQETSATPELLRSETAEPRLRELWDLCCREQSFPRLSSLIRFVEGLKTDELARLLGGISSEPRIVVSTLHKVKGLEFDSVFILPSFSRFPLKGDDLKGDAAEEARLFYVGMTRARNRLFYFLGEREGCWRLEQPMNFSGQAIDSRVLTGESREVYIDWAFKKSSFHPDPDDCQHYIEREVSVGDPILLSGTGAGASRCLMHRNATGQMKQIGFLANDTGIGGSNADLKVAAVIRFPKRDPDPALAASVVKRGWGYVVLVSGRLR
jgi:RecQ family ATP-dependent DNA helicase